jgi:tetratricopeptide (TPR) repeat protein
MGRRYERRELVGKGGAGSVYRAVDVASGEVVALKVLSNDDPRALERFGHEARALLHLSHPHVVRYVDHGVNEAGEAYLAMEWLEGESLSTRLARGALSVEESVGLARDVAAALAMAHERGIVHRDIKPSNLFLVGGRASDSRLLDFGLVHVMGSTSNVITRSGGLLGTPGYMSPEQARGERETIDARADVFSLGAVLFQCVTGRRAFEGVHVMALLAQLLLAEVPRVRELVPSAPPALDDLIARMLSKDPGARPENGRAVLRELEAIALAPAASAAAEAPRRSITGEEQRLLAVIAIKRGKSSDAAAALERVRSIAAARSARTDELAGGAILVTLAGHGSATDQAAAAARCALRIHAALPDAEVALVTGHGEAAGRLPVGPVVDRAADLLASASVAASSVAASSVAASSSASAAASSAASGALSSAASVAPSSGVHIDAVTRALLDDRFEVAEGGGRLLLTAEREIAGGARTLLGRPSPYVGRERELRVLLDLVTATFEGERSAQAAIVTAAAGMGKTRLRHELVKRLREARPDMALGVGRADALSAGSAFVVVGAALRHALGLASDEAPPAARARIVERIAPWVPAASRRRVAAFLGEIAGVAFPAEDDPELLAARQSGPRMAEEVTRAFVDFLRGVSAERPVLLVLEDLHWGDAASVKLVDQALRDLSDRPLVVLALGRPEMHELFPDLWSKREVQSLRLGALPRRAAEELVARSLGRALPEGELSRVVDQAAGNAFYLEELIRAVAEGRGDQLPETVLGMVEARLSALPAEARRLLRAASVFGEAFSKKGALALLGESERQEAAQRWLPWLVEREILVRRAGGHGAGDEEHAFRHALLREGSYAMLTERDRVLGHRLAGHWMRGVASAGGEVRPAVMAEHFFRGEEWDLAARAFDEVGDTAARLYANVEAREHYLRSLSALEKVADSVEQRRRRVDTMIKKVAISYGDDPGPNLALLAGAEAIAAGLPGASEAPSDDFRRVARVCFWMGRCHWYRNAYPEAIGYYQRTLAAAQKLGDDELTALPAGTIGRVLMAQGHFGRCLPTLERALGPLWRTGNKPEWVVNHGFCGVVMSLAGRRAEAVSRGEEALARARELKNPTSVSIACVILGGIHTFSGDPALAREMLRAAAEEAERAGDRMYAYLAYGFDAWAASRVGDHEEAARQMERARAIMREFGRRLVFADWFDAFAIEAAQRAGRPDEAIAAAAAAAPGFRATGSVLAEGIVQRAWGLALTERPEPQLAEAAAHLAESLRLLLGGEAHVEAARTRLAIARLHALRGDAAAAAEEIEAARRVLAPIGCEREITG